MILMHKGIEERWFGMSLMEQLANVGADVSRAIRWKNKNKSDLAQGAFDRSLELFYLVLADPKNKKRLAEICRAKEVWIDYFMYDNQYGFTDEAWENYFYYFNYVAALERGR